MAARINPPVQIGQYRDHTSQFIEIRQRAAREHQVSDSEDVRWVSTPFNALSTFTMDDP